MDSVDKRIILSLMRNARVPLRRVAEEIGISAQALNYRLARLKEGGVIRRYILHVQPSFYGMVSGFAAFSYGDYQSESIVSRFRCLEEVTIYEFAARDQDELAAIMKKAGEEAGTPVMTYIPEERPLGMNITESDRRIVDLLREDPRMPVADIARVLDAPVATVRRRLGLMEKNRIISVIAEIDLTRVDSVIYSIISRNMKAILPAASGDPLFVISDRDNGILVCYSDNLRDARASIEHMRKFDPGAEVMVVYEYEFRR